MCVKLVSLIRINFVHLNQNSRFFCIKTRFLLLKFSRFKLKTTERDQNYNIYDKFQLNVQSLAFFSDYLGKVVQMDWKSRLFLKQNNFTPYFSLILEMFETLLRKIVVCCFCCCLFVCFMQNLIFFYSSTRTQLEDLHKFDQKKTLEQVFGQNDFTKLLGSCRRLRLGYLKKYIFLKNVCFALVVYIIDSIIELES